MLLRASRTARRLVPAMAIVAMLTAALVVAQAALLSAVVTDAVTGPHVVPVAALALLAGVLALRGVVTAIGSYTAARASVRIRAELRGAALSAVAVRPEGVADPAAVAQACGPGLDGMDGFVARAWPARVSAGVVPGVVLAAVTWADWRSGVVLFVLLPLVPLFMVLIGVTTRDRVARRHEQLTRLGGRFVDTLRGLVTLRAYGRDAERQRDLAHSGEQLRRHTLAELRVVFLSGAALDLITTLSVAVVAVEVGLRLVSGAVPLSTALVVLLLAPELFAPLRAAGTEHHAAQDGAEAVAPVAALLQTTAPTGRTGGEEPSDGGPPSDGDLVLDAVTVQHPGRPEPALDRVDLRLRAGAVTALVGASGAGKSTVLALLRGVLAPTSGRVTAGTHPLDAATAADAADAADADAWRAQVAWLPQRPRPTRPTVGDEVRLGDPQATDADVADVCRRCAAPPPHTVLAEDGHGVSAGQRRRIALARAVLRTEAVARAGGRPLVLLDEPSEDLDPGTERVVADVVRTLDRRATVVVASHSAAVAALADDVVTLADGRVLAAERRHAVPRPRATAPVAVAAVTGHRRPADVLPGPPPPAPRAPSLRSLLTGAGALRPAGAAITWSAASALAGLGLMAASMWLILRASTHPGVQALAVGVVAVRACAIARPIARYLERLRGHDAALRALAASRVAVFGAVRRGGLPDLGRGDLLRRFVADVDGVQDALVRAIVPSAGAALGAAGGIVLAAAVSPVAGWVVGGAVVTVAAAAAVLAGSGGRSAESAAAAAGARDREVASLVEGLEELQAYGATADALRRVSDAERRVARRSRRADLDGALGAAATDLVAAVALPALVAAGAAAVRGGSGIETVGLLVAAGLVASDAIGQWPRAAVAWRRARAASARVAAVTGRQPDLPAPGTSEDAPVGTRDDVALRMRHVTVAPAAGVEPVARDVTIDLATATCTALAGASGSGKTTLLAGVLGLTPLRRGTVSVRDGATFVDVARLVPARRAELVAGSLQGDHVFDATLAENLRLVRPDATDADLDAVAVAAGLTPLVATLPERWQTRVGVDGRELSGGERQRLLLARAVLSDPAVLVLDEPTAHLDAATEAHVVATLERLAAGRTVLLATHRAAVTAHADRLLVLEDGAVYDSVNDPARGPVRSPGVVAVAGKVEIDDARGARRVRPVGPRPAAQLLQQLGVAERDGDRHVLARPDVRMAEQLLDRSRPGLGRQVAGGDVEPGPADAAGDLHVDGDVLAGDVPAGDALTHGVLPRSVPPPSSVVPGEEPTDVRPVSSRTVPDPAGTPPHVPDRPLAAGLSPGPSRRGVRGRPSPVTVVPPRRPAGRGWPR
ncbi:thiol reductant ABC exporter subunit CydD [Jatrophihabitans fulvus]